MKSNWRVEFLPEARHDYRHLAPSTKAEAKSTIQLLAANPWLGKPLTLQLEGYYSARFQHWRIIYTLSQEEHLISLHMIRQRALVYADMELLLGHHRSFEDDHHDD